MTESPTFTGSSATPTYSVLVYDGGVLQAAAGGLYGGEGEPNGLRSGPTKIVIKIGEGAQVVNAGAGRDKITSYSDGGEPDPAQTDGAAGRINPPIIIPAMTMPRGFSNVVRRGVSRDDFFVTVHSGEFFHDQRKTSAAKKTP